MGSVVAIVKWVEGTISLANFDMHFRYQKLFCFNELIFAKCLAYHDYSTVMEYQKIIVCWVMIVWQPKVILGFMLDWISICAMCFPSHFTNNFFHCNLNSLKISFCFHPNHNPYKFFAHGTTAELLWHVQKFVVIPWPKIELQRNELSNKFE